MIFRPLYIDYKAEALQILREEKEEERLQTRQCSGSDETRSQNRKRVIRILVDPAENVDHEETSNLDSRELPSWLSLAISKGNTDEKDVKNDERLVASASTSIGGDYTDGSNDHYNMPKEQNAQSKPMGSNQYTSHKPHTIDWNAFYSCPWLLELVLSIRLRIIQRCITNEMAWAHSFYNQSWDTFVACFSPRIHHRIVTQDWIQNLSLRNDWKRLDKLQRAGYHTKVWNVKVGSMGCHKMSRSIPKGDIESNALVVYRRSSSRYGLHNVPQNNTIQRQSISTDKNKTLKLWETAMFVAFALFAYQKQQKSKSADNGILCQSPRNDIDRNNAKRKATLLYPTLSKNPSTQISCHHSISKKDETENDSRVLDKTSNSIINSDHPQERGDDATVLISNTVSNKMLKPMETKERKRFSSPSHRGNPKQKRHRQTQESISQGFRPSNANLKRNDPKTEELEKRTKNALLFFRRFAQRSKTNCKTNDDKSTEPVTTCHDKSDSKYPATHGQKMSIVDTPMLSDIQNDDGSNDSEKCLFGRTPSIVDYSSPIEFPNSFDDYDDEDGEEAFTDDIVTNIKPFQAVNPQSNSEIENEFVRVKQESDAFPHTSTTDLTPQLSNKKKRRKRTMEEKLLRKKEKRRRSALKEKNSKVQSRRKPAICEDAKGMEKELDDLETPRKLEFRDFSPSKKSKVESRTKQISNKAAACIDIPNDIPKSPPTIRTEKSAPQRKLHEEDTQDRNIHQKDGEANDAIGILCSEPFIEHFGDVIAQIVRENSDTSIHRKPIRFTDTELVDACSVDIEVPSGDAVVVSTLSQIQHSGGVMKSFLPKVIEVSVTNRYNRLAVFVCVDIPLDSTAARDLVRLQTAFLSCEKGLPRTQTTIQLCSRKSLGTCISRILWSFVENNPFLDSTSKADYWLSDSRTCQRLKFLLSIIPTLSVTGALYWLDLCVEKSRHGPNSEKDESIEWFQRCFRDVHAESKSLKSHLLGAKPKSILNPCVPRQLVWAVNARFKKS